MTSSSRLKFRNVPTALGGLRFASRAEARRYGELLLLQRAGCITNIVCQPRFPITIHGVLVVTYVGDFSYTLNEKLVVEDVKSPATRTPLYRLKKRLMKIVNGIDITEVESRKTSSARNGPKKYHRTDK